MTDALHFDPNTGIAAIGVQLPPLAMDVRELAALRGVDPDKYTLGLGCDEMALCPEGYGVVDLAVGAAKRADDAVAERAARDRVHDAKVALGERGVEWWAAEVDEAGRADRRDRARRVLERRTPGPKWTLDDAVEAIAG